MVRVVVIMVSVAALVLLAVLVLDTIYGGADYLGAFVEGIDSEMNR